MMESRMRNSYFGPDNTVTPGQRHAPNQYGIVKNAHKNIQEGKMDGGKRTRRSILQERNQQTVNTWRADGSENEENR